MVQAGHGSSPAKYRSQARARLRQMPASGLAAAAARGVGAQGVDVGVIVERQPGQAPRGRGQEQRSERALDLRDGGPGRQQRVGRRPGLEDRASAGTEPGVVVGAFIADALRARLDPFDDESGVA